MWKCSASALTSICGGGRGGRGNPGSQPQRPSQLLGKAEYGLPDPEFPAGDPSFLQGREIGSQREKHPSEQIWEPRKGRPPRLSREAIAPTHVNIHNSLFSIGPGTPSPPLLPPTGPITSKGSPRVSGNKLDTSSCPQRPPWKALPITVALENRGLTWKAMSPESVKKLISNLWVRSVLRVRSVAGGSLPWPQEEREALTCPLQYLHVPVLSGSSLGPGPLHRRLRTEGKKTQGTEPHRLQPPTSPPRVLFIQEYPFPPSPRPPPQCCSGWGGPETLPPQSLCLGSEEKT